MKILFLAFSFSILPFSIFAQSLSVNDENVPFEVAELPDLSVRASLLYPVLGTFELSIEKFLPNNKSIVISPSISY